MDRDDRRRYFVVGSVNYEIVTPLFRQRLENDYRNRGFASFQVFANSQPIIHILFHLRHTNVWCCQDKNNCRIRASLPLNYNQWDLLFTQVTPAITNHLCHCQYTANSVQLDDLDLTLAGLILLNCCNLGPVEEIAIKGLRKFKNNYLSHNTKGSITQTEYNTLWPDLTRLVLQLDNSKQDDLIRIENRPLDESLCMKYCKELLDVHKTLQEMNDCIQQIDTKIQGHRILLQNIDTSVQGISTSVRNTDTLVHGQLQVMTKIHGINMLLDKFFSVFLNLALSFTCCLFKVEIRPIESPLAVKPYKLGQPIFHVHHQFNLRSVLNGELIGLVAGGVLMDDGRLVLCLPSMYRLLICDIDGSKSDSIPLQYLPFYVTAINNSTVAVTAGRLYIEMYDIDNKHKLKSIHPGGCCSSISTINNKIVTHDCNQLYIIDHQTGEVEQLIINEKDGLLSGVLCVHATAERIFYINGTRKLYCYSYTDHKHSTIKLKSTPLRITTIYDGSLYVVHADGSLRHLSSDGKRYKKVATEGLKSVTGCMMMSYNQKQRKLVTCTENGTVKVFNER